MEQPSWHESAVCADEYIDPELFFIAALEEEAKEICAECPVAMNCLLEALRTEAVGVWGGLTDKERKQLRKKNHD